MRPYVNTFSMPGVLLKPFKGILYNEEKSADISQLVCPPYDVIADATGYYKRSSWNAIRLELPVAVPPMDQYATAKHTMKEWLEKGILLPDKQDSIYVYEQEFRIENTSYVRRGFIALTKLDKKRILTHEETRKKAKADREQLISTLKMFTSLIFGLYEDAKGEIEDILAAPHKEKIYDFTDEQSINNRFYRMTDANAVSRLASIIDSRDIYVADGHHRLDVSYRLGLDYAPLYLANMYSPGIVILPYHRIVKFEKPRPLSGLLKLMEDYMHISRHSYTGKDSLKKALSEIGNMAEPSFLLYSKDDLHALYMVTVKRTIPSYESENVHECLKKLKVNIVHSGIIKNLLKIGDEEISFTQDHYGSIDSILNGSYDLAFLLQPTSVAEVKDIADNGLYMPPKSTFFHPKILTGLVFCKYA